MTRQHTYFAGLAGLVVLLFSVFTQTLIGHVPFAFSVTQFGIAAILLSCFLLRGGLSVLRSAAAKRAAGFGTGIFLYTSLFLALLAGINYAVFRHDPFYFDSTEQKVFTLAPQTQTVLHNLNGQVQVLAFFIAGRVEPKLADMLDQMAKLSPNFRWRAVDPEKEVTLAEKLSISSPGSLYFTYHDGTAQRVSILNRELSEQQVVNEIIKLSRGGKPKVIYYLRGHGEPNLMDTSEVGYSAVRLGLEEENMKVQDLVLGEVPDVPTDSDLLLIISPSKPFLPAEFEALSRYLERGGSAALLADPHKTDDLARLAALVGIHVGNDVIVDRVVRLFQGPSLGLQPMVADYSVHPITRGFSQGTVYSLVCSVRAQSPRPADRTVTEIAFTSKTSWAERDIERVYSSDPRAELDADDLKGPVSIAAASEKTFKNEEKDFKQRVIVIGDADFAANVNIRQLFNRDFLLNCLNWAVGEEEGVTIRERTMRQSTKTITAEQFTVIFLITAIVIPELMLIIGLGIWWYRKL
jgi:ABC-type uncharacterized transport system involved in gliding motility auxiliary subunit